MHCTGTVLSGCDARAGQTPEGAGASAGVRLRPASHALDLAQMGRIHAAYGRCMASDTGNSVLAAQLAGARVPRWRRPWPWILLALLAVLAATGWWWLAQRSAEARPRYVTETVRRGDLLVRVTATGTLQPTNKVDVGSELSGTVARVLVDINDRVHSGQVLAVLDTSRLAAQMDRSTAALAIAQAAQRQAEATARETAGNLARLRELARLTGGDAPAVMELAAAEASFARARAGVASAQGSVADARAALSADVTNLRKASIRSPIDGVVLARNVDPGNAVAASLQAVTLFTLAEDLARMKLAVNVDEADIGLVRAGQRATFNVSAYPGRDYPASVSRVSYGSGTKDNVVTYETDLLVDNGDLSLRPGMSATATIVAAQRQDVLLVPNAALRFAPAAKAEAPAGSAGGGLTARLMPRLPRQRGDRHATTSTAAARAVWVLQDGKPVAIAVRPGLSDGRLTEVASDTLRPGMAVIVDQGRAGP